MAKKAKTATEQEVEDFVQLFARIKAEKRGVPCKVVGLSEKNNKKLKVLLNRGFEAADFERAINQMYMDSSKEYPLGYAWETKNDLPIHLLVEDNFERYLNKADVAEIKKAEVKEVKDNAAPINVSGAMKQVMTQQPIQEDIEKLNEAKYKYTVSLNIGEWTGNILDAMAIGVLFTNSFTSQEKIGFLKEAEEIVLNSKVETKRVGGESMADIFERMAWTYPKNVMFELVIKEAIKRKIKKPWGE